MPELQELSNARPKVYNILRSRKATHCLPRKVLAVVLQVVLHIAVGMPVPRGRHTAARQDQVALKRSNLVAVWEMRAGGDFSASPFQSTARRLHPSHRNKKSCSRCLHP
jgi:hypothetical protein